jgi:small neutral amino acid transporter SnatA (MarC family)
MFETKVCFASVTEKISTHQTEDVIYKIAVLSFLSFLISVFAFSKKK